MPYRRVHTVGGLGDNHVQHSVRLADGRMAITTWSGINLYDGSRFVRPHRNEHTQYALPGHKGAFRVGVDADNRIWVKRWSELWCLELENGVYVTQFDSLFSTLVPACRGRMIENLFVDHRHGLWLQTADTLWETATQRPLPLPRGVGALCDVERTGNKLWLFTNDGRWVRYTGQPWHEEARSKKPMVEHPDEYWYVSTKVDSNGNIWQLYGGHRSSILRIDPATGSHALRLQKDMLLQTFALRQTSDGTELWAGSRHGVFVVNGKGEEREYRTFPIDGGVPLNALDVAHIYIDPSQDIWLSSNGQGLLYCHPCPYAMHTESEASALGIPDSIGTLLHQRRSKQFHDVIHHPSNDELTDRHGRQWTAMSYALIVADRRGQRLLTTADGLAGDYVQALVEDRQGTIWAATNRGISAISLCTNQNSSDSLSLEKLLCNPSLRFSIQNYGPDDGCQTSEYLPRSGVLLSDGRICFEGLDGWTAFSPDSVRKPTRPLMPRLVNIYVNGTELQAGINADGVMLESAPPFARHITLAHNQNSVEMDFSAFTYDHPQQTFYRWRFTSGRDTLWQTASHAMTPQLVDAQGGLHLAMMKLAPGHYRVEVCASTNGEDFRGEAATFSIHILPPWWQTWWAYTLYIVGIGTIIFAFVRFYVHHQRREMEWQRMEEVLQLKIRHLMEEVSGMSSEIKEPSAMSANSDTEPDEPASLPQSEGKTDVPTSSIDTEFLQRVVACIEKHLGEDYSVSQLASDLCMERTGLYKRLTTIIDETPQLFIRSIRLHKASELLTTSDMSISDIAYSVGFSSASYLVKCFREKYGCTPGEWRDRENRQQSVNDEPSVYLS